MKRTILFTFLILLVATSASAVKRQKASTQKGPQQVSVQVREAAVKASPNYMGATVGTVRYSDRLTILGEQGSWYQISAPAGWIPKNAARKGTVKVDSDKRYAGSGVRHDEAALAGKGFNPTVERQFKADHADLAAAFGQVDRVERMTVSNATLRAFAQQGKLNP